MSNIASIELFRAYIRFADGQPEQSWEGLTYNKARWRYHWIKREYYAGRFRQVKEYGYQSNKFNG